MNCIFCKIMNGEIPSYTVFEDENVKAFLDVNPDSNGHLLIVPKEHYVDLTEIPNPTLLHIMETARILKKKLEDTLDIDGLTLIQNNGDVQDVKHFHLHLKPYYREGQEIRNIEEMYDIIKE